MGLSRWIVAAACMYGAAPLHAEELLVRVMDARGAAVADAVVSIAAIDPAPQTPASSKPVTRAIDQKDETFIPYVEVFRPGDQVVFRNSDKTRHHVYSFSPTKSFELVLRPGESSPALTLDKAGVIAVGCNIHDHMLTYLYVTDAALAVRSGPDGVARLENIPPGSHEVRAWHPQLRPDHDAADIVKSTLVTAGNSAGLEFSVRLLPDPRRRPDRERATY